MELPRQVILLLRKYLPYEFWKLAFTEIGFLNFPQIRRFQIQELLHEAITVLYAIQKITGNSPYLPFIYKTCNCT